MKKKLVVITGPTGSGKTALAITLAQQLGTEIVSVDSRQVYREMKIGTAQPSQAELLTVTHHLIGHRSVHEGYDATLYASEAEKVITSLFRTKQAVLLCGGTGLYIKALLDGLDVMPEIPDEIRAELILEYEQKGLEWLRSEARKYDPVWYSKADQQNPRRLLRCVEVFRSTGKSISKFQLGKPPVNHNWDIEKFEIELPREILYRRIDERVLNMVAAGLFEEAEGLYPHRHLQALDTVGYQEIFDFMDDLAGKDEAIALIQQHTRNYAKRQMTWFRKDQKIFRINPTENEVLEKILSRL